MSCAVPPGVSGVLRRSTGASAAAVGGPCQVDGRGEGQLPLDQLWVAPQAKREHAAEEQGRRRPRHDPSEVQDVAGDHPAEGSEPIVQFEPLVTGVVARGGSTSNQPRSAARRRTATATAEPPSSAVDHAVGTFRSELTLNHLSAAMGAVPGLATCSRYAT